jgi:hypothetical protein
MLMVGEAMHINVEFVNYESLLDDVSASKVVPSSFALEV